jgi:hypothetical protein
MAGKQGQSSVRTQGDLHKCHIMRVTFRQIE